MSICVWKMLVRKMCSSENKMWIINIGLPVLLFVIAVQCSEPELSREAAFQGMLYYFIYSDEFQLYNYYNSK